MMRGEERESKMIQSDDDDDDDTMMMISGIIFIMKSGSVCNNKEMTIGKHN